MSNDQHTRKFYQKSFSNFFYGVVGVQYAVSQIMGGCPRANQYAVSWHMLENFAGPIIIFNPMTCRLKNTSIRCYSTDSQFFEGTLPTARFDDYLMVAKYFTFSNVKSYVQSLPKLVSFVIFILKRSVKKVWALSTKRIIRGPPPPSFLQKISIWRDWPRDLKFGCISFFQHLTFPTVFQKQLNVSAGLGICSSLKWRLKGQSNFSLHLNYLQTTNDIRIWTIS